MREIFNTSVVASLVVTLCPSLLAWEKCPTIRANNVSTTFPALCLLHMKQHNSILKIISTVNIPVTTGTTPPPPPNICFIVVRNFWAYFFCLDIYIDSNIFDVSRKPRQPGLKALFCIWNRNDRTQKNAPQIQYYCYKHCGPQSVNGHPRQVPQITRFLINPKQSVDPHQ